MHIFMGGDLLTIIYFDNQLCINLEKNIKMEKQIYKYILELINRLGFYFHAI
jgi:hypothetical protein